MTILADIQPSTSVNYRDVEIHIHKPTADATYPCTLYVRDNDQRADGVFVCPFSAAQTTRALAWMEQGLFDADYVKEFGATLFDALFKDTFQEVYTSNRDDEDARLRLRLIIDAPAVARIPWELLYDRQRNVFLSLAGPFVRGTSLTEATRPLLVTPPLRILVLDAFPEGVLRVQGQAETSGVRRALADLIRSRRVEVVLLEHASLRTLQNALREAATAEQPFHLLHFIGHGQHDPLSGRTVLLFEDADGKIDEVDADALVNILRPYDLKLVFLNACQSLQSSALDLAQGFAPALLRSGVPAVIGMQVTVLDAVALQFSHDFYAALADNEPVDGALVHARQLARGTRHRHKADLGIPICYLRTASGQIVEVAPPEQIPLTRDTWRPWLRERMTPRRVLGSVWVLITLVGTLLGLYWGVLPFFARPAPMTGGLNVAVAEFGAIGPGGRVVESLPARALADGVHRTIADEIEALTKEGALKGYDIQVREPALIGRIQGNDRAARARSAQELAADYNIDVLVYGNITPGEGTTSLTPEFYLSVRTLETAEELVGQYDFGLPIEARGDIGRNPVASKQLSDALLLRTSALAEFIIGLGHYVADDYDTATTHFEAAEQSGGWPNDTSRAVLYLFLGNTAGRRKDWAVAERHYAQALAINPEYSRAWVGAADIRFQNARNADPRDQSCASDQVDVAGLNAAIDDFRHALSVRDRPPGAALEAKAAFGLGRVYFCLSFAGVSDQWADSEQSFQNVIADFERDNTMVKKELASEAHAALGLLYWVRPVPDEAAKETNYRLAAEQYQQAIERNRHADRKAFFYTMLGQLYNNLEQDADIDRAFAEAIRLDPQKKAQYEQQRLRLRQGSVSPDAQPTAEP